MRQETYGKISGALGGALIMQALGSAYHIAHLISMTISQGSTAMSGGLAMSTLYPLVKIVFSLLFGGYFLCMRPQRWLVITFMLLAVIGMLVSIGTSLATVINIDTHHPAVRINVMLQAVFSLLTTLLMVVAAGLLCKDPTFSDTA
jgi:hypothetical protein